MAQPLSCALSTAVAVEAKGIESRSSRTRPLVLYVGERDAYCALEERGFEVRRAGDRVEGLDAFLTHEASAVILDVELLGAHAFCRDLKALTPDEFLPIVFVGSNLDVEERIRLLAEGDEVCSTAVPLDEVAARLCALLRLRERETRLANERRTLARLALVDPLTELANRRAVEVDLEREWKRTTRSGRPLACLVIDIDRFKAVNDRLGHLAGDQVLRRVGRAIENATRLSDRVFRWGGDEFVVLLPSTTGPTALYVAERIRRAVSAPGVTSEPVTVSIGVAVTPHGAIATREDLVEIADRALGRAKALGRNRVASLEAATVLRYQFRDPRRLPDPASSTRSGFGVWISRSALEAIAQGSRKNPV